jgi:xanthine/CO dehydrogenase XdhC/CoxF family maturation factor
MRELDSIRFALSAAAQRRAPAVLCTVMGVEGSVYRGAGARMVITGTNTTGAVSGGCLEADLVARAPDVIASGSAELARYDTRVSDDVVLGLGLGCQGIIDVLMEPLAGASLDEAIALYERIAARRDPVTVVTLLRTAGDLPVGARVIVDAAGKVIEGDERVLSLPDDISRETIRPATPLVICGAGTDAIPLVRLAKQMGWHVTVVDHRASFVTAERFPEADVLVCANLTSNEASLASRITIDQRTMAVVMAHSAAHDRAYLHAMLDAHASYVGVLGPRRRTMELLGERAVDGNLPDAVHAPVGLDLGAESPDEIALAIVAEVAAVNAGRRGGLLRDHRGPIHDRNRDVSVLDSDAVVARRTGR